MRKSNPLTTGARAATYSRFSTGEQGREGLNSCETQDAINAEFAAARGWSVVATYRDEAKTGRNLNRKGWRALLADAQAGKFDVVVVNSQLESACAELVSLLVGNTPEPA